MKKVIPVIIPILVVGIILATACGISEEVLAGVETELDAAQQKFADLQEKSENDLASVEAERDASQEKSDATQAELDELKAKLDKLIVAGDTVRGHIPSEFGPLCAVTSQWHPGELVVWRFRIWDPETGSQLPGNPEDLVISLPDADELASLVEGLTATVHLSDGQSFPARFAGHGGEGDAKADYFWTTSWEIPVDYPTGALEDWVTVEWSEGDKTGISQPYKVAYSMLTIVEGINEPE